MATVVLRLASYSAACASLEVRVVIGCPRVVTQWVWRWTDIGIRWRLHVLLFMRRWNHAVASKEMRCHRQLRVSPAIWCDVMGVHHGCVMVAVHWWHHAMRR